MKRERDALLLHNCNSENGITTSVRAKTPEPAPPLNLPAPRSAPTISQYFERPGAFKQKIFKGLDAPREGYPSQSSDTDEEMEASVLAVQASSPQSQSQLQARQRSYLTQPSSDTSQTLRNSVSSKSLGSDAAAADAGRPGPGFQSRPGRADPVTPTAKRKRSVFLEDSDEEFGGDDLNDSETERKLAAITDESARKQQRTKDVYETPPAAHGQDSLPTPVSRRPGLLIASDERERTAKRQRHAGSPPARAGGDDDERQSQLEPERVLRDPETPTPYRKVDVLPGSRAATAAAAAGEAKTTPGSAAVVDDYPRISDEVLSLLAQQPVSESTKRTLKAAMARHEMRVKGVARGREAARAGIAERDARIGELQGRVVALENGRKMDKERLRELSSGLLKLSQED
ncbi:hypothetical protein Daus18300_002030 [Diaporthe australafricana]|uniref:Uncharacterized protein n=1 Tax=Diaporthe australafricana TaxID=127596 RepID=A0ABR3XRZ7_9PEZI